jgi:hypothetical protein
MNIVLVKHNNNPKEFAFYVPEELLPYVKKGSGVLCKTTHGLAYGTATTGVISGDGARDVALAHGAYIPIKPIVGIDHPALAEGPNISGAVKKQILDKLATALEKK